jgi:hypothetical protein
VEFKLAILTVLATRPDGRATLDELKSEVGALAATGDRPADRSSALDDIDIFQSGLVVPDDGGLRITDTGRSALKALEDPGEASLDLPPTSSSHSLKLIDGLIGTEERLRIFDLELRSDDVDASPEGAEIEDASLMSAIPAVRQFDADLPLESTAQSLHHEASDADLQGREAMPIVVGERISADAPAFRVRDGAGSGAKAPGPGIPLRSRLARMISGRLQQALAIWRRHLERDTPTIKTRPRTGKVSGAAIALLTVLVLVICAGAVIALTQIRSLKSEVAALQRELSPLRERAAKADLLEKAKQSADQQKEVQNKSGTEKNRAGAGSRIEQAALNLTPEEIRLIRDFIKPAPAAGAPAPAINVGDTVSIGTIPLPSPLMEKIPKLLGARFTTRNGSIIILRRDSRQADVVLPPS